MNGSGTKADPYVIGSTEDLALLSGSGYGAYAGSSKYFVVGCDLDFAGGSFTPIGDSSNVFNGHFDGRNHVISAMVITGSAGYLGLFSRAGGTAEITRIVFRDCTVTDTGTTGYVGMVAGRLFSGNGAKVSFIETDGCTISTTGQYAGGITGLASRNPSGTVEYADISVHNGSVTGSKDVGGIAGQGGYNTKTYALNFVRCRVVQEVVYSTTASADDFVGGITGLAGATGTNITYTSCRVLSSVIYAAGYSIGGIAGNQGSNVTVFVNGCEVDNCLIRSSGGGWCVGGIVGWVPATSVTNITDSRVTRCTIYGSQQIGGFIGAIKATSSGDNYAIVNPVIMNNCIYAYTSSSNYAAGVIGRISPAA